MKRVVHRINSAAGGLSPVMRKRSSFMKRNRDLLPKEDNGQENGNEPN